MEYLKMKYERFLMTLFDWVFNLLSRNDNLKRYPSYAVGCSYVEIKNAELELKCANLEAEILKLEDKISNLLIENEELKIELDDLFDVILH